MLPLNHRAKWTDEEMTQLLKEVGKKNEIEDIAKNHERTVESIRFKLIRYACKLIDENPDTSFKHIQELTNLSKDELLEGFKKIKYQYDYIEEDKNNELWFIKINIVLLWIVIAINTLSIVMMKFQL